MERIDVEARNYFQFRRLLKLAYSLGYKFRSGKTHSAFSLWFANDRSKCKGLSLENDYSMRYIEKHLEVDTVDFKEYLRIVHGVI